MIATIINKQPEGRGQFLSPRTVVFICFLMSLPFYPVFWGATYFVLGMGGETVEDVVVDILIWSLFWGIVGGVIGLVFASIRRYAAKFDFAVRCFIATVVIHVLANAAIAVVTLPGYF